MVSEEVPFGIQKMASGVGAGEGDRKPEDKYVVLPVPAGWKKMFTQKRGGGSKENEIVFIPSIGEKRRKASEIRAIQRPEHQSNRKRSSRLSSKWRTNDVNVEAAPEDEQECEGSRMHNIFTNRRLTCSMPPSSVNKSQVPSLLVDLAAEACWSAVFNETVTRGTEKMRNIPGGSY